MRYPHLLALAALCLGVPASASTLSVSVSGSDSANGVSSPVLTLARAVALAKSGDTIELQSGNYTGGAYIETSNLTLRGVGDVTIDGSGSRVDGISLYQVSNFTIDNLKIKNASRYGIFCVLSSGVTIKNCDVSYNGKTGILTGNTSDLLIQNNTTAYNKLEHGIYCSQSGDRIRILNNRVIGNVGSGLQVNAVEDSANASAGASSDSRSMNCLIANNVMTGNCQVGGASMNFMGLQNSVVVNNLAYNDGNAGGMALWDDGAGAAFACKNNQILHNTLVFAAGKGKYGVQCAAGSTGNQIKDNILVVNAGPALDVSEAVQSNCNLFGGTNVANGAALATWRNNTGNDQNSQVGSPMLDANYRPQAGSPCVDGGEQVYSTDMDGSPRPQGAGPDIGCYETGGASGGGGGGGPTTPTTLAAPSGLSAQGADSRVSLTWNAVSGATGYGIFRSTSQNGAYAKVSGASASSFVDTGVSNGTTYWYKACTTNSAGDGALSAAVSATPKAATAQTFSISGTVTLNGVGLSGATVAAGGQAAVSNANGAYAIPGLAAGSYTVSCSLSGYTFNAAQTVNVSSTVSGVNFAGTVNTPAPSSGVIYDDKLAGGWASTRSKANYNLANKAPVQGGSASISLNITGTDGYVQLSGAAISTTGKSVLRFAIHGGTRGNQYLRVRAVVGGTVMPSLNLWSYGGAPKAGQWTEYSVPLADLQAAGVNLTNIRFMAGKATKVAYVDNIRVE